MNVNSLGEKERILPFLQITPLFRDLPLETVSQLADHVQLSAYHSGETIWRPGDKATRYTIIKRGMVQLSRPTTSGDRSIIALFGTRDPLGLPPLLGPGVYPAHAIALTSVVELCQIDKKIVDKLTANSLAFAQAQTRAMVDMYFALQDKIEVVSAGSVCERLVALFTYLSKKFGDEDESGYTFIPVTLTRAQMANMVGARIETIIRTLSGWQKSKALICKPHGFFWAQNMLPETLCPSAQLIELPRIPAV